MKSSESDASADAERGAAEVAREVAAAGDETADEALVALDAGGNLTAPACAAVVAGDSAVDGDVGLDLGGRAKVRREVDGVHCVVCVKAVNL